MRRRTPRLTPRLSRGLSRGLPRRLVLAAGVAAAAAAPFAQPASAVCETYSPLTAVVLYTCDGPSRTEWCATAGVQGAAGARVCGLGAAPYVSVTCWTAAGVACL